MTIPFSCDRMNSVTIFDRNLLSNGNHLVKAVKNKNGSVYKKKCIIARLSFK